MNEIKRGPAHPSEAPSHSTPLRMGDAINSITQRERSVNPHSSGDLARFLRALAHKIPESARGSLYLEIAWLPAASEAVSGLPAKAFPLTALAAAAETAHKLNAEGFNVYYGLNPRAATWTKKGAHAATEDVAVIVGFCVDDPKTQVAALVGALPPPSFIVETSPGKFQALWLLREPTLRGSPLWDRAERLQAGLKAHFEAEAGDVVRVLRCPYTRNLKYDPPAEALVFVVRAGQLVPWGGDPDQVFRYLLEELERLITPVEVSASKGSAPAEAVVKPRVSYKDLPLGGKLCLRKVFMEGSKQPGRNNAGIILASELRKLGKGRDAAEAILRDWNERNKPPLPDHELVGIVKSAYKHPEIYDYGCDTYRNLLGLDDKTCEKCEWLKKAREQAPATAKAETTEGETTKAEKEFSASMWRTFEHIEGLGTFVAIARGRRAIFIDQDGKEHASIRHEALLIRPPFGVEVHKGLILYPTDIADYTAVAGLLEDLIAFYRRYYEAAREEDYYIMALYALTTWFTPALPAVPILNFEGPSSKGKSRGSEVVWLTCAYPYRSSGTKFASWVRTVDRYFPATLFINEADFDRRNPEAEELIKFYNNRPVRAEAIHQRMLDNQRVLSFNIFGPTISTTRQPFDDDAVERRTFKIRPKALTDEEIPFNLGPEAYKQAQNLRNQLAGMALEHLPKYKHHYLTLRDIKGYRIEPRLAQLCEGMINIAELVGLKPQVLKALEAATVCQKEVIALTRDALIFRGFFAALQDDPDNITKTGITPGKIAEATESLCGVSLRPEFIGRRALALGFVRYSPKHYLLPPELYRERAMDYLPLDELEEIQPVLERLGLWK